MKQILPFSLAALLLGLAPAYAEEADLAALDKEYGELASELAGEQMDYFERKKAVDACFSDPKYETEATRAIRKRIEALKREIAQEIAKAEAELREEIAKNPEVRKRLDDLAQDRAAIEEKLRRFAEVKARREAAQKAERPKPRPQGPADAEE